MTRATSPTRPASTPSRRAVESELFDQEWESYRQDLAKLFNDYCAARAKAAEPGGARQNRAWRDSSKTVYWNMWRALIVFLIDRRLRLEELTAEDVSVYLAKRAVRREKSHQQTDLNLRYQYRLISLLNKLITHDATRRAIAPNQVAAQMLAADELSSAGARDRTPLPRFLTKGERTLLMAGLRLPIGSPDPVAPRTWVQLRDNAAVAVQLGAGLTPGEVRALRTVDDITSTQDGLPWRLQVVGNGNMRPRHAELMDWAGKVLQRWLEERSRLALPGSYVFCTENGAQWSKNTCEQTAEAVFARFGIAPEHGKYRLRHSYVLIQVREKKRSLEEVAALAGVKDTYAWGERYRRSLDNFKDT